ncbi:ROK family protein [Selenihalanaerobacter shriftii]|uniref:Glucokinase n=1 Tax=Selenihalanaerobacter shriftii TaxID=142842 RepID=A0A1T4KI66_9FIRM|nr:ROK family protein [Selenihalanaerobacter shriftii]SJZ42094.1 glucokinase [Selenihalanaerobacter shriftii]
MQGYVIGVDLGGTKILTALADLEGEILAKSRLATLADEGQTVVVKRIIESIEQVLKDAEIKRKEVQAIGVGCPGPLNVTEGIIYHAPNLGWKDVNIKELIKNEIDIPVFIENDANAAALGEKWFGAGRNIDNLIYMTVSTGIGGGIIINRKLYHGANDSAGEIGHIVIDPASHSECGCGDVGCWEAIASGTALGRLGKEAVDVGQNSLMEELVDDIDDIDEIDGAIVTKAAAKGDKVAGQILEQVTNYLGIGVANLVNILNPEMIIVGGGVSQAGDMILQPIREVVNQRALKAPAEVVKIVPAQLESEVGVVGAIAKALVEIGRLN